MARIVTGDDAKIIVMLMANGKSFVINPGAIVTAAVVSSDHKTRLTDIVPVHLDAPDTDLSRSTIVVLIPSIQTAAINVFKPALLEIQVNDTGKQTWFADVSIIKGQID